MIGKSEVQEFIQDVRTHLNYLENAIGDGVESGGPVNPPAVNPPTIASGSVEVATGDDINPDARPKDNPAETVEGMHAEQTSKVPEDFPVSVPSDSTTGDSNA